MKTPQYVYHTLPPGLANLWQVNRTLEQYSPRGLRDAGIGGTAVLYLFVNTDGSVDQIVLKTSSGHPSLDWAAVQAAKSARFLPASNEGIPVGIWIEMEMPFVAR
jgi:protein TonB